MISRESIVLNVFREILITCINKANFKNQSKLNKILICDIESVRFIQKIIFLIDMNTFIIWLSKVEKISLLNKRYILGDPSVFEREKYFFLELLISCRKQIIISWANKDNDKKKLDISFPIKELLYFFKSFLTKRQINHILKEFDFKTTPFLESSNHKKIDLNYSLIINIDWVEKNFYKKDYKLSELIYWSTILSSIG